LQNVRFLFPKGEHCVLGYPPGAENSFDAFLAPLPLEFACAEQLADARRREFEDPRRLVYGVVFATLFHKSMSIPSAESSQAFLRTSSSKLWTTTALFEASL
jgi:hypothetical protein